MKKFLAALIVMIAVTGPAIAQKAVVQKKATMQTTTVQTKTAPTNQRAVMYTKELKTKLGLNENQYTQVLRVNTECIRREDVMKTAGKDMTEGQKDIKAFRTKAFGTILTPAQMTQWSAMDAKKS